MCDNFNVNVKITSVDPDTRKTIVSIYGPCFKNSSSYTRGNVAPLAIALHVTHSVLMRARTQHERVLHAAHTRTSCAWRARRAWRHAVRDSTFCPPPPPPLWSVWVTRRMMKMRRRWRGFTSSHRPSSPSILTSCPLPLPGFSSLEILLSLSPCQPYSTL